MNQFSHANTYVYNTCSDNGDYGFAFDASTFCVIENNTISYNHDYGVILTSADSGTIMFNEIEYNALYGVHMDANTDFFTVHHNNFISNNAGGASQALEDTPPTQNAVWYDVATNEGNYWDDYVGTGNYDIDGTANEFDPYPLAVPVGIIIIHEYSKNLIGIILGIVSIIGIVSIFGKKR